MYSGSITAKKLIFSFSNCSTHFFGAHWMRLWLLVLLHFSFALESLRAFVKVHPNGLSKYTENFLCILGF